MRSRGALLTFNNSKIIIIMLRRPGWQLLLLFVVPLNLFGQEKDSVETMNQFINVCSSYKQQLPLYLNLEYSSSSNIITAAEDSAFARGEFYLLADKAYVHFGDIEEIVNDSMALIISGQIKRMRLYKNAQPMIANLKASMGMEVPKSAMEEWSKRFAVYKSGSGDKETIELKGRSKVSGTDLSKEVITLLYNKSTKEPAEVITVKRSVLLIEQAAYDKYKGEPSLAANVIMINNDYYLIKEQKAVFSYKQIDHRPSLTLPVSIVDRVEKSGQSGVNKYKTLKGFEEYVLTEE